MDEDLNQLKPAFCIVDNSIAFTGAFRCALVQAQLLGDCYKFIFVVPNGSAVISELVKNNFNFYTLPLLELNKSFKSLLYVPRLLQNSYRLFKILKKENVKVLQINDVYNLLGVLVKQLGYRGKLITYVRFLPSVLLKPLRKIWIGLAQRFSNIVIAVSDAVLNQLPQRNNTLRIYDPIVLSEHLTDESLSVNGRVRLLYLANYIKGKGQDYALNVFASIVKEHKNFELKFVGGDMGLTKNRKFKESLQKFVAENDIGDYVHFESFHTDIEQDIKEADIVLNFSEAESFSMTCAEAGFYGVPVIATRCGGPEEIIEHNRSGILVANRNLEEMKKAILSLSSSSSLRKSLGTNSKEIIRKKFSEKRFKSEINRAITSL